MSINWERYDAVLNHIEQHPEEWRQTTDRVLITEPGCFGCHVRRLAPTKHGESEAADKAMVRILGVSREQAWWLFDPIRTLADFKAFRDCGGIPGGAE